MRQYTNSVFIPWVSHIKSQFNARRRQIYLFIYSFSSNFRLRSWNCLFAFRIRHEIVFFLSPITSHKKICAQAWYYYCCSRLFQMCVLFFILNENRIQWINWAVLMSISSSIFIFVCANGEPFSFVFFFLDFCSSLSLSLIASFSHCIFASRHKVSDCKSMDAKPRV